MIGSRRRLAVGIALATALATAVGFAAGARAGPASFLFPTASPLIPTTSPKTPGKVYVALGGFAAVHMSKGFEYGSLQTYNGITIGPSRPMFSFGKSVVVGGGAATLGYALDRSDPLGDIGSAPRLELAFTLFRGTTRDSSAPGSCDLAAGHCDVATLGRLGGLNSSGDGFLAVPVPFLPVNGSGPNASTPYTVHGRYHGRYWGGDGVLRYRTDFHLTPMLIVSPSVGIRGGAQVFEHKLDIRYDVPGIPNVWSAHVRANLSSFSVGPELGTTLTWRATPRLSLHGGVTLAALYRHATLSGRDCGTGFSYGCPLAPTGQYQSAVDSSRSRLAVRLGLQAGATFAARPWLRITVMGFGSYDSAVPGIARNDTYLAPSGGQPLTSGPARIVFSGDWTVGGAIMLTIPFG